MRLGREREAAAEIRALVEIDRADPWLVGLRQAKEERARTRPPGEPPLPYEGQLDLNMMPLVDFDDPRSVPREPYAPPGPLRPPGAD
jgi:hypothetical protein